MLSLSLYIKWLLYPMGALARSYQGQSDESEAGAWPTRSDWSLEFGQFGAFTEIHLREHAPIRVMTGMELVVAHHHSGNSGKVQDWPMRPIPIVCHRLCPPWRSVAPGDVHSTYSQHWLNSPGQRLGHWLVINIDINIDNDECVNSGENDLAQNHRRWGIKIIKQTKKKINTLLSAHNKEQLYWSQSKIDGGVIIFVKLSSWSTWYMEKRKNKKKLLFIYVIIVIIIHVLHIGTFTDAIAKSSKSSKSSKWEHERRLQSNRRRVDEQ